MSEDEVRQRTRDALEAHGLADMRPAYRKLLVRLRNTDSTEFEAATRRYADELEPSVTSGRVDPVTAWLEYGCWLASRLAAGHPVAIDRTGRSRPFEPGAEASVDSMIVYLSDDDRTPNILLAVPRQPSEPQRVTADLLVP